MRSESARFRSCNCLQNMSRIFLHSTKSARDLFSKVFFVLSDYSLYTIKAFRLSVCKLFLLHDFFCLRCRSWSNSRSRLSFFLFSLWLISFFWSWFFYWAWLLGINHNPERNWVCASSLSALRDLLSSWSSPCLSVRFFFFSSMLSYSAEFEEICVSKFLIESIAHWKSATTFCVLLSSQAITRKPEIRITMMITRIAVIMFFAFSVIYSEWKNKKGFYFWASGMMMFSSAAAKSLIFSTYAENSSLLSSRELGNSSQSMKRCLK